jgi:NAD(P)-dependent dehydrogenase (short-subunit alcohol dehydrogenase family)
MTLNVQAVFTLTQQLLPLLKAGALRAQPSSVINIGSINGIGVSLMDTFSYSASKAAVHQLTRVMAAKMAEFDITVNAIAPGPFPTKMTEGVLAAFHDVIVEGVPFKRVGRLSLPLSPCTCE